MKSIIPLALGLLVSSVGCFHSADRDVATLLVDAGRTTGFAVKPQQRIAVLTFAGNHGAEMSDILTMELLRKQVDVVERDSLDRVVAEVRRTDAGFYNHDMSDAEVLRSLGKVLGADVIIFGEVQSIDPNTVRGTGVTRTNLGGYRVVSQAGEIGPKFNIATALVSMRAFNTKTGQIVWWCTAETYTQSLDGKYVKMLDYLRLTAKNAAWALTDQNLTSDHRRFADKTIPR